MEFLISKCKNGHHCLNIGIPRVFGVSIAVIIAKRKHELSSSTLIC